MFLNLFFGYGPTIYNNYNVIHHLGRTDIKIKPTSPASCSQTHTVSDTIDMIVYKRDCKYWLGCVILVNKTKTSDCYHHTLYLVFSRMERCEHCNLTSHRVNRYDNYIV